MVSKRKKEVYQEPESDVLTVCTYDVILAGSDPDGGALENIGFEDWV